MNRFAKLVVPLVCAVLFVGCSILRPAFDAGTDCEAGLFTVSDQFQGARRGRCVVTSATAVRIDIQAEDDMVANKSPWFAFKVLPQRSGTAEITLRYFDAEHRYWPKTSSDGVSWTRVAEDAVIVSDDGLEATLRLRLANDPVWVAAQELITPTIYDIWSRKIAEQSGATLANIGESRRKLPISKLDTRSDSENVLLIVGRQHPPEVSGAFAFFGFTEALLGNSVLAKSFRDKFRVIAIPLINPDGVIDGNWRHNLGRVDLNRDWGPFTQPETQAVQRQLAILDARGKKIRMFADFHSTHRNLLYSQNADFPTDPPRFTPTWLGNSMTRLEDYPFSNEAGAVSDQANSKNYMYKRYKIPAVTFEVGDETDRAATRRAAAIFAEELMKLLLEQDY